MAEKITVETPVEKIPYKLTYRHLKSLHNITFIHTGDLDSAIAKGKTYCRVQKTDFINVEPLYTDLDLIIDKKSKPITEERIPGRAY